ncbi:Cullin-associated NEDD8-dissociated protein 1 [Rhizoclosmatium sp. JEL0117]|nr:Cullin-associated NEDD8-dissociated protein 1 [Rhizoclosmatium sp. JEL0117]
MSSAYVIAALLEKLNNADSDFRYMAMADLSTELQKDSVSFDEVTEKKIVAAIIRSLDDKNGEVQNLAVKTLAPLVRKSREQNIQEIVDQLCNLLVQKKDELKDIAAIGLKTVVLEVPVNSQVSKNVVKRLVPKLIALLSNSNAVQLDTIDILSDVLIRFGGILTEASNAADPTKPASSLIRQIQDVLFPYLSNPRPAIRKRAVAAFGNLVVHTSDELFDALIRKCVTEMGEKEGAEDFDRLKTFVGLVATLARYSSRRLGKYIEQLLPLLSQYVAHDDDELREACFQTFEAFVLRCPTEITPFLPSITSLSLEYMTHDPNYDDGEDDEEMETEGDEDEDDEMDEDEDEDDDEGGYSDDEDMSWKVRRSSVKALASIISTRNELVASFFDSIAPTLVKRFKEREESVRVEILNTFTSLIRQVGATSSGITLKKKGAKAALTADDPTLLLQKLVTRLSKNLSKELNGKSVQTRQSGFVLLKELVSVLHGGLDDTIALFVASIEASLASGNASSSGKGPKPINNLNLKIEVLEFLKVALTLHNADVFTKHFAKLVPPVLAAINGKFYKVTSDALVVAVELVKAIRPIPAVEASLDTMEVTVPAPKAPKAGEHILNIYKAVLDRVKVADLDIEVKERSIIALSTLIAQTYDFLPASEITATVLPLLVERLRNELTRLVSVRAFKTICDSPLVGIHDGALDFSALIDSSIAPDLASFLRKANRQLRLTTLTTLAALFTKFGSKLSPATADLTLNEVQPVIAEADMNLFPLALELIAVILSVENDSIKQAALLVAKASVANNIVNVIVQAPHLAVSGSHGSAALVQFWGTIVRIGGEPVFNEMVQLLVKVVDGGAVVSKQSYRPVAQSIGALIVEAKAMGSLNQYVSQLAGTGSNENHLYLSLNIVGVVGRSIDLSTSHPNLPATLLNLFAHESEEIKHAAAFALGNIALGNLHHYMPIIIQTLREGGKRRYLVLVSLKEVIARSSSTGLKGSNTVSALAPFAKDLWALLFESTEQAKEEATRNVIAECLGKLSMSNPQVYLSELVTGLKSNSAAVRATIVMAIRYTFTDVHSAASAVFDEALSSVIVEFLRLLTDSDLNVRHIALATLNSAAHNKPYLITESLGELLPLLYQETIVKEELIHIVVMGPFKHKVDDGLDARKSAYECMHTLLERCLARIEIFAFLDRVVAGLGDAAQEIKMLNHTILQRVVTLSPAALLSRLDAMVPALKEALSAVPKANAVKQEIEKVNELVRSAIRAVLVVGKGLLASTAASEGGVIGGGSCPVFDEFFKEITAPGHALAEVVKSVSVEVDAQPSSRGNAMDLS